MFECTRARWWNSQIPGAWSNWDYRAGLAQNSPSTREGVHSRRWSLRVALVIVFLVVLVLFVLFVFFFVWLFSNEDMGSYRTIGGFCVDVFCTYSAHAPWYASCLLASTATNGSDARLVPAGAAAILMWRTWDACVLTFLSRGVRSPQACRRVKRSPVSACSGGRRIFRCPSRGKLIKSYHRTSDIIHLSPETLGWDWRAHSGRPRQFRAPHSRWG